MESSDLNPLVLIEESQLLNVNALKSTLPRLFINIKSVVLVILIFFKAASNYKLRNAIAN